MSNYVERAEKIIGVPKDSMIRIGDCGDIYGNDYLMLDCKQGYSVDKTSGSIDKCFPIFDKNGEILKGVLATLELINAAKILPTVCLESADKSNYKFDFAFTEKNIVLGRKKLLNKYNDLINLNFGENEGIDSLFDKSSGSIIIPMYEWELLSGNPLKDFWSLKENNCFKYLMKDDNNYLLRGSSTYYYFIANRKNINSHGIAGLRAALGWIQETGIDRIRQREQDLMMRFYEQVKKISGVTVYGDFSQKDRSPVVTLNIMGMGSSELSMILGEDYGISTRSGGHCAPLMHQALGTEKTGAVRFSFSCFNTEEEVDEAARAEH